MPFVKASSGVQVHYLVPSCLDHSDVIDHTKPTVVLLHPRFFDSHFFTPQTRDARLARGYNLVTLDHHYHGRTTANLNSKPYDFKLVSSTVRISISHSSQLCPGRSRYAERYECSKNHEGSYLWGQSGITNRRLHANFGSRHSCFYSCSVLIRC
jgi:hypothetical protein